MKTHRCETPVPIAPLVDCLALLLLVLSFAQAKAQWEVEKVSIPVVHSSSSSADPSPAPAQEITLIVDEEGKVWCDGQEVSQLLKHLPRGESVRWRIVGDRRAPYEVLARLLAAQPHVLLEVSSDIGGAGRNLTED
jgi:biopolymer transport protein ExbD